MQDWPQVVAVSISALVAAAAALGGAWLQGRLGREAAAEAHARQAAQDHANATRIAVFELLAALDNAAQAANHLIDPLGYIAKGHSELTTNVNMPRDRNSVQRQIEFAREVFATTLSKMNEVRIREPILLSDSIINEVRTVALQFNHILNVNLWEDKGIIRGGMNLEQVNQIYLLHSRISKAYDSWINKP